MDYCKFLVKSKIAKSDSILKKVRRAGFSVNEIETYEIFCVLGDLKDNEKKALKDFLFCNNVIETCEIKTSPEKKLSQLNNTFTFEVMLKPGVTDTQSREAINAIMEMGFCGVKEIVSGTGYIVKGNLSSKEKEKLAQFLCNDVIQFYAFDFAIPQFVSIQSVAQIQKGKLIEEYDIANMSDEQLQAFSDNMSAALDLVEMQKVCDYFKTKKRKCTDAEFEMIAQTWSEHCVHKTFKAKIKIDSDDETVQKNYPNLEVDNVLKTYIKKVTDEVATDWIVSSFVDNAGIVKLNDDYDISFKVETHNHPSAIEPFGGANTGVGGVIRDVMGVSARPFAITDVLCFGNPSMSYSSVPKGSMHPNEIISGVVAGISDYGNKMGIANVNGGTHFAEGYTTNPLVYCGCAGISPHGVHRTKPNIGDHIFTIGATTGRDAIRGATFSSMIVNASTGTVAGSAVQTGDPIIQKKICDAVEIITKQGLYSAITDCGAGGFSSAVGEMASKLGCDVDLTNVPVKYDGLQAWEVWVSESQERMVLAVPEDKITEFLKVCEHMDVQAFDLGFFTGDKKILVRRNGNVVIDLDCEFLHSGPPQRHLVAKPYTKTPEYSTYIETPFDKILLLLLSDINVCSREKIVRRYDHEVQGGSILKQYDGVNFEGPTDAAVIQPREIEGKLAVAFSNALNFRASAFGCYKMTENTIDETIRSLIAVGADPSRIGILDNYCMGDPNRTEVMWDLVESARACYDVAKTFKVPFISGKDSFNNEYLTSEGKRVAIPASLLISAMAVVPNIDVVPGTSLKQDGNSLYLLGKSDFQFAASVFAEKFGIPKGHKTQMTSFSEINADTYQKLYSAIQDGMILTCHDISDGGLLVAISEMCIGGNLGAKISTENLVSSLSTSELQMLFGETTGCFIIEVESKNEKALSQLFSSERFVKIGFVTDNKTLQINTQKDKLLIPLLELKNAYSNVAF